MKKLYIHIGYPKTATSSIQQGLHQNSAELALHGYCYPATGLIGVGKHALAHDIQGNVHSRIQQLIREMRSGSLENFILSSERFATFSRPEIEQLQRVCADFDTYIVVYLRQQDAFIQSLWSQKSKIGVQRGSFVDWVDVLLATPGYNVGVADEGVSPIPVVLDYEQTLRMWARVFGLDHILVRPFERSQLHPNILVDLLQTCGMQDTAWVPEAPQVNVTPSMKTTEVLRTLGERLRPTMDTQDSRYGVYQVAFNMMQHQANAMGWDREKSNYITRDLHEHIMAHFEVSNHAVAATYLGRDQLFVEPFREKPVSTFSFDQVSGVEIIDLMQPAIDKMIHKANRTGLGMPLANKLVKRMIQTFPATAGLVNAAKRALR